MKYTADKKSISKHEVPEWFHDAKFGIFIHWGLYSVPAFAVTGIDMVESLEKRGVKEHMKNNPYAEWYLNTLRIPDSATEKFHIETYGKEFSYDDFVPIFNEEIKKWNPEEMVDLFKKARAKYVVLVTKHHDGFTLWPSKFKNPNKDNYCTSRDIVGELTEEVKKKGMKMGFYYSGILDWSFNPNPIKDAKSFLENGVITPEYTDYANNHWRELIDLYEPMILWNDISYPPNTDLHELFAYFYNKFPDGVVNDRFSQPMTKERKFPRIRHKDFVTPEYKTFKQIKKQKWEKCRGLGNSFGYNKQEIDDDYLTPEDLIRMFVDTISKNGNLLLNVGPMADGTIPDIQKKCLSEIGKWLEVNGEAIYGTRPWKRAEGKTLDNTDVRYTQKDDLLFAIILDKPKGTEITIESLTVADNSTIKILGYEGNLTWKQEEDNLTISIPDNLPDSPAFAFKILSKTP